MLGGRGDEARLCQRINSIHAHTSLLTKQTTHPYHKTNLTSNLCTDFFSFFRMLNEMEDDLETATDNLSLVTIKTKELIQKSGGKRNFILIVLLSVVVIVLLFLIVYA